MIIYDTQGLPVICDTEGCGEPAATIWSGVTGKQTRACNLHNPQASAAIPLPVNFTSHPLCQSCGQPIWIGATA